MPATVDKGRKGWGTWGEGQRERMGKLGQGMVKGTVEAHGLELEASSTSVATRTPK